MPFFVYTAQDEKGNTIANELEAADEMDAIAQVQRQGLLILNIREDKSPVRFTVKKEETKKEKTKSLFSFGAGIPAADLIFLAEQLALLLKGGVPLLQGLKLMGQNVSSPLLKKTIEAIGEDIAGGDAMSVALAKHPKIFEDIWIAMLEAGEASGQLPKALEDVSAYLNQRDILRTKVITAFMYPSILVCMSILVLVFFIVKIVPVFSDIFESFNMKLPPLTAVVIVFSKLITHNLILLISVIAVAIISWKLYVRTEAGQWFKARLLLKIPFIGNFVLSMMVERLLINFALLLKAGVDVIKTLLILEKLFGGNKIFSHAIISAREAIKGGGTISQAFSQTQAFPGLVLQMMRMGEESGRLPEILETLSLYYRRQIDTFIGRLSTIIEPIVILGVGAIVTVIVLAVFMPIFELSQIGGGGAK